MLRQFNFILCYSTILGIDDFIRTTWYTLRLLYTVAITNSTYVTVGIFSKTYYSCLRNTAMKLGKKLHFDHPTPRSSLSPTHDYFCWTWKTICSAVNNVRLLRTRVIGNLDFCLLYQVEENMERGGKKSKMYLSQTGGKKNGISCTIIYSVGFS